MYASGQLHRIARKTWDDFLAGHRVHLLGLEGSFYLDRSDPRGIWAA